MDKKRLIEILELMRRFKHTECEDGFYSCPAHPDYFGVDGSGECRCGLVEDNANLDEALRIINADD
ncbi:MAG: hypothetical protein EHM33_01095 [Chloroflexi bacterium]|nr:MAG: hypothetical protein EHM33_01095 [Chloroflexota bacterium]